MKTVLFHGSVFTILNGNGIGITDKLKITIAPYFVCIGYNKVFHVKYVSDSPEFTHR